ncbi:MAG TPA: hypothetical protein VE863_11085 [Pyrinomonadaceae bacterium]|jgi:hypothetical protein|nr:hypothetical protein [Pyrinomonadaceae bacterium]
MKNNPNLPTEEEVDSIIDRLLPANEDMDAESASIILEREGIDRPKLARALRLRLERRIERMRAHGEEIPETLIELANKL